MATSAASSTLWFWNIGETIVGLHIIIESIIKCF